MHLMSKLFIIVYADRPACHLAIFQAWESFLQEAETDSQACNDVASVLSRQVSENVKIANYIHEYSVWQLNG